MLDDPLPKLHRMAHQLNPTVVSTTLNPLARLASLPFAPVEGNVKTLAHLSLHPGVDVARNSGDDPTLAHLSSYPGHDTTHP